MQTLFLRQRQQELSSDARQASGILGPYMSYSISNFTQSGLVISTHDPAPSKALLHVLSVSVQTFGGSTGGQQ